MLDAQYIAHGLLVAESRADSLWMDCWCREGRAVLWPLGSGQPTTGHFLYCIICRKLKMEEEKAVTSALVSALVVDAERKKVVKLKQSTKPPTKKNVYFRALPELALQFGQKTPP